MSVEFRQPAAFVKSYRDLIGQKYNLTTAASQRKNITVEFRPMLNQQPKHIRYKRRRKSHVLRYNERNFDAEVGDLMVDNTGRLYRLEESGGRGKRDLGELYPREIVRAGFKALIEDGEVYFIKWK